MTDATPINTPILTKGIEIIQSNHKYIVLAISLLIAGISINDGLTNSQNNESVSGNVSTVVISLVLGIGYFMFSRLQSGYANNSATILPIVGMFMFVSMLIYTFVKVDIQTFTFFAYVTGTIATLIFIIGLAIFFYIFSNYLKSFTGWTGFFVYFLFYIPCLLLALVNYIISEFKLTTNPVLILFVIEILLLLVYVYIPDIINHVSKSDSIAVLEDSRSLNSQNVFDISNHTKLPDMDFQLAGNTNNNVTRNYAMSLWTYVNAQNLNNMVKGTELNIFDYGNGKPKITYYRPDDNVSSHKYRIYFTDAAIDNRFYEMALPMQRWNNLVFNYSSTHVDLFVNGRLERTFSFVGGKTPINNGETIITGSPDGLHGAISNIRYYPKTVSKSRIANMYNIFLKKTPPTINL